MRSVAVLGSVAEALSVVTSVAVLRTVTAVVVAVVVIVSVISRALVGVRTELNRLLGCFLLRSFLLRSFLLRCFRLGRFCLGCFRLGCFCLGRLCLRCFCLGRLCLRCFRFGCFRLRCFRLRRFLLGSLCLRCFCLRRFCLRSFLLLARDINLTCEILCHIGDLIVAGQRLDNHTVFVFIQCCGILFAGNTVCFENVNDGLALDTEVFCHITDAAVGRIYHVSYQSFQISFTSASARPASVMPTAEVLPLFPIASPTSATVRGIS